MAPVQPNSIAPRQLNSASPNVRPLQSHVQGKLEAFISSKNSSLSSDQVSEIAYWIHTYSKEENMDPMLVAALINRESSFNANAVSATGAKGLGQIKDFNHQSLGIDDPFNVQQNVRGTVRYLKHLSGVWKDNIESKKLMLASYFQGPNATKKQTNTRMPAKVNSYVDDILTTYQSLTKE